MADYPTFTGCVNEDGKLYVDERRDLDRYLKTLAGKAVDIVIRKVRAKRSMDQNAYWWAVPVKILAEHCGYTDAQMHYALLGECFGYVDGPQGKPIPVKPSSSDLTVEEFTRLIEWVLDWASSELGVFIPSPDKSRAA